MSKIAEQKALEVYPLPKEESYSTAFINQETFNSAKRTGYAKGYDQAMQDLLTKACEWLHHNTMRELVLDSESTELVEDFVDDFKNYMQDAEI